MRRPSHKIASYAISAAALAAGLTLAGEAEAKPNITRKGGQFGVMLGGSVCIPGKANCSRDAVTDGGVTIDGDTRPNFGANGELGYRFNKYVFLGASYNIGFFSTNYTLSEGSGNTTYKRAYQNSIYGVVRPTLPVWRFDFGLGLGPGFSRQVFVLETKDKDYSQGFSFLIGPSIDVFITRRIFLGAKMDLLLNAHGKTCQQRSSTTTCSATSDRDLAPVHQMIFGLHIGGTFL